MIHRYNKCRYCRFILSDKLRDKKVFKDQGSFYVSVCRLSKKPMIVLKKHKECLTKKELEELNRFIKKEYPNRKIVTNLSLGQKHWHTVLEI